MYLLQIQIVELVPDYITLLKLLDRIEEVINRHRETRRGDRRCINLIRRDLSANYSAMGYG